jgi:LysM repeat protein
LHAQAGLDGGAQEAISFGVEGHGPDTTPSSDLGSIRLFFASLLAADAAGFYFRVMQRNHLLAGLLAALFCACLCLPALPQDAAAEREEREANYKRMLLKMEGIEESLQAQSKRITTLVTEINALREDVDRLKSRNESAATQESLKRLAEKIEEVDKKRLADSESVTKRLREISKGVNRIVAEPAPAPAVKPQKAPEPTTPPKESYTYQIKEGDTLVRIVSDLRAQNYKITQKQVMDANPGVNWSRLKIGQTVIIPGATP